MTAHSRNIEGDDAVPQHNRRDGWNKSGVNRLQPSAYQHQVGRAGCQQADGKPKVQAFAAGLADRAHGQKHRAILARESRAIFLPGFRTRLRLRDSRKSPVPEGDPA